MTDTDQTEEAAGAAYKRRLDAYVEQAKRDNRRSRVYGIISVPLFLVAIIYIITSMAQNAATKPNFNTYGYHEECDNYGNECSMVKD